MKKDNYLTDAAQSIIEVMETPQKLVMYLTDALHWVHKYENKIGVTEKESEHWSIVCMIQEIVIPWISATMEDQVDKLTEGVYNLYDCIGYDGLCRTVKVILLAYNEDSEEAGSAFGEAFNKEVKGIQFLFQLRHCLGEYDFTMKKSREAELIS